MVVLPRAISLSSDTSGKENSANALSRLPVDPAQEDAHESTEYAFSIASEAASAALTPQQVVQASAKDPTLLLINQAVTSGDWSHLTGTRYRALVEGLRVLGQLPLKRNRFIMPEASGNIHSHIRVTKV